MRAVAAFTIMMMMYNWIDFPTTPLSYHFLPKNQQGIPSPCRAMPEPILFVSKGFATSPPSTPSLSRSSSRGPTGTWPRPAFP